MTKVIILQPVLAHYRKSVFTHLLNEKSFNTVFITGKNYENIKGIDNIEAKFFNYAKLKILSHNFYFLKGAFNEIRRQKPDIIISSGIDFHLIHTIIVYFFQKIIRRKRFIWWSHATLGNQGWIGKHIRLFFYRKSDGILTYSNKGYEILVNNGISKTKIKAIGNAINEEDYGYLNYNNISKKKTSAIFSILFCGRLTEQRGLDILFKALKDVIKTNINVELIIVGDGPSRNKIEREIIDMGIKQLVKVTGALYEKDVHQIFLNADLLVYPKSIGLTIVQAFSFGIPVITSNDLNQQMPEIEILQPGKNGDFYVSGDYLSLSKTINKWYYILKDNKESIAANCITSVYNSGYLPKIVAKNIVDFLN